MSINYSKYFPVEDYYEKVVVPLNPRRFRVSGGKMICPLHDDHDPSFGIIKKGDGNELCHCFGCNWWGNIIKLHQSINKKYSNKYISPKESLKELCSIFGVNYNSLPLDDSSLVEDRDMRQELELGNSLTSFDIGDFKHLITEGKRKKKGIGYFNALLMTMVNEVKSNTTTQQE